MMPPRPSWPMLRTTRRRRIAGARTGKYRSQNSRRGAAMKPSIWAGAGLAQFAAGVSAVPRWADANYILTLECDGSLRRDDLRRYPFDMERTFARETAMSTHTRHGQTEPVRTAEQLRQWLAANRVYGLSAGQPDIRWIEATSLADGSPTSIEVPADLLRALDSEMVWMDEVDTLPDGILLALRSQLGNAQTTAH
jgi:hypothetical protein